MRLPPHGVLSAFETFFRYYGNFSGAQSGFGYFAPEIGSELRSHFEVVEADGSTRIESLSAGASREAALRINNLVALLGQSMFEEKERRKVAASLAGKVLARHPGAPRVALVIEELDLPSMASYREGKRPSWKPFYRVTFARRKAGPA